MTPDQALEELVQLRLICLNCSVVDEDVLLVSTRAQAAGPPWPGRGLAATGYDALPSTHVGRTTTGRGTKGEWRW